ncbi:NUDIX domain-containing protein [Candidatus Woesearchaeota archaeon]|nr:NUDIX domain-containing protein [Candidatus Woesearchaeota archaeon]
MKKAKSCSAIIYKRDDNKIKYLLVKHEKQGGGHWSFPKGHVEEGETEEQTALREIKEETGLEPFIVVGFRKTISYIDHIKNEDKTVVFFLARSDSTDSKCLDGIADTKWLSFELALETLSHDQAKELLRKADAYLNSIDSSQ